MITKLHKKNRLKKNPWQGKFFISIIIPIFIAFLSSLYFASAESQTRPNFRDTTKWNTPKVLDARVIFEAHGVVCMPGKLYRYEDSTDPSSIRQELFSLLDSDQPVLKQRIARNQAPVHEIRMGNSWYTSEAPGTQCLIELHPTGPETGNVEFSLVRQGRKQASVMLPSICLPMSQEITPPRSLKNLKVPVEPTPVAPFRAKRNG